MTNTPRMQEYFFVENLGYDTGKYVRAPHSRFSLTDLLSTFMSALFDPIRLAI